MFGIFMALLGLTLIAHLLVYLIRGLMENIDDNSSISYVKNKRDIVAEKLYEKVRKIKKPGKTLYYKGSSSGVLALHDNGKITVNMSFKHLMHDLPYKKYGSFCSIKNPTEKEKKTILDRLYD